MYSQSLVVVQLLLVVLSVDIVKVGDEVEIVGLTEEAQNQLL